MKDEYNALLQQRQPGFLVPALGGRVEQYYALEKKFPVSGAWGSGEVSVWAEQLKASAADAEVLLRFGKSNGWLDGQPAVITPPIRQGPHHLRRRRLGREGRESRRGVDDPEERRHPGLRPRRRTASR